MNNNNSTNIIDKLNNNSITNELLYVNHTNESQEIFELALIEAKKELGEEIAYRLNIFKNVKVFNHVDLEDLHLLAKSLEVVYYKKGEYLINQGDEGDALYILEDGYVTVTRTDPDDNGDMITKKLATLGPNRLFGEVALVTDEPRNASIYIESDTAKCLKLTRDKFKEVIARKRVYLEKNRILLSNNVIKTLPFLSSLPPSLKSEVACAFNLITIQADTYILREGSIGNTFYILIFGSCVVSKNLKVNQDNNNVDEIEEVEVNILNTGDYFGEMALINPGAKRSANVKSLEQCTCLSLSRQEFERLLNTEENKAWFIENTTRSNTQLVSRSEKEKSFAYYLSKLRRISGFDCFNVKNSSMTSNLFERVTKFMTESLYNSLYSRLYRQIVLNEDKLIEYGSLITHIYKTSENRDEFIGTLQVEIEQVLKTNNNNRTSSECTLLHAVMSQRNNFLKVICQSMPHYMYKDLILKAEYMKVITLKTIVNGGIRGKMIYVILRGAVRLFSVKFLSSTGKTAGIQYEQDLCPGDVFGEDTLKGASTPFFTAIAITDCELLCFTEKSFMEVQDSGLVQFNSEEKTNFLKNVPTFRDWKLYQLFNVAKTLRLDSVDEGTQLVIKGLESQCLYFIVNGIVNLVQKNATSKKTICCLQKYDYFGETGLINSELKKRSGKVVEQCSATCNSKCLLLVLEPTNYNLVNIETVQVIYDIYKQKVEFRQDRFNKCLNREGKTMRRYEKKTMTNVDQEIISLLPTLSKSSKSFSLPNITEQESQHPSRPSSFCCSQNSTEDMDKPWWNTDELVAGKIPEDYNMLLHSINDPVMLVSTIKGSERKKSKILESLPTSIEDVTVRYKNKISSELQDEGYTSLCRSDDEASTLLSNRSSESDMSRSSSRNSLYDMSRSTSRSSSRHDLSAFFLNNRQDQLSRSDHGLPSNLWKSKPNEDRLSKSEHNYRSKNGDDLSNSEHNPRLSRKSLLSNAFNFLNNGLQGL